MAADTSTGDHSVADNGGANHGAADHGLFGPGSVTWRIMDDPVLLIAGMRALYLQALHPDVMLGTWQNTTLTDRVQAWGRFARTTEFVRVRTFGSTAEVERAARRIRKVHASLTGVAPGGRVFRLDEPDLLLWVHCGEIASYADVARRCGMPVSAADLDAFVAEQVRSAEIIGLDARLVPASMADLDAYYAEVRPRLHATPEARQALRRSFTPVLPLEVAALYLALPSVNTLALASLPRWARRLYGSPASPVTDLAATVALRAAWESTSRIPRPVLYLPFSLPAAMAGRSRRPGLPRSSRAGRSGRPDQPAA